MAPLTFVWPGVPKQPETTAPSSRLERYLTLFCIDEVMLFILSMRLLKTQFYDKVLLDKYMNVKSMGIKKILRGIWLISANMMKSSKPICKRSSQTQTR